MKDKKNTEYVYTMHGRMACEMCGYEIGAEYAGKLCVGCGRKITARKWPDVK